MKLLLAVFSLFSSVALSQSGDWQDSYPRMEFTDLLTLCENSMGEEALTCETTCLNFYGLMDLKYEVEFTYKGASSELTGTKKRYIDDWINVYLGDRYKDMFQHEILFSNDSVDYRIAVQEPTFPYYSDELKNGDSVYLYLLYVGTLIKEDVLEHVFVANDFLKVE